MKFKHTKILIFFFICIFSLTLLYVNLNHSIEKENIRDRITITQDYYTIKEYNGKVAVFKNNEVNPTTVFESYTSLLPEKDRQRLQNGIRVESKEELQKVIEDFTS